MSSYHSYAHQPPSVCVKTRVTYVCMCLLMLMCVPLTGTICMTICAHVCMSTHVLQQPCYPLDLCRIETNFDSSFALLFTPFSCLLLNTFCTPSFFPHLKLPSPSQVAYIIILSSCHGLTVKHLYFIGLVCMCALTACACLNCVCSCVLCEILSAAYFKWSAPMGKRLLYLL